MSTRYCANCGHPQNLTPERRDKIRAMFLAGERPVDIAREMKVSRQTVYRVTDDLRHQDEPGQFKLFELKDQAYEED